VAARRRILVAFLPVLFAVGCGITSRSASRPVTAPGGQQRVTTSTNGNPPSSAAVVLTLSDESQGPSGTLEAGDHHQVGVAGDYCWNSSTDLQGGAPSCVATTLEAAIPRSYLDVAQDQRLAVIGGATNVDVKLVIARESGPDVSLEPVATVALADRAGAFVAPPGDYTLVVHSTWPQGEGDLYFGVRIVAR
jgi:hypothetical protein